MSVMDSCMAVGKDADLQKELLSALQNNDIQLFAVLLQKQDADGNLMVNPDYQYGDPHYATCLELACKGESPYAFIKVLLANNADPNNINTVRCKAPIHIAIENHNHEALEALLQDKRTDVNIVDNFGNTALHIAVKNFQNDPLNMEICVMILMSHEECKINKRNRKGRTALEEAANFGGREVVEVILKHGKDKIDIDDKDVSDKQTVRDMLLKKFPDLELPLTEESCNNMDHETLKAMLFKFLYFKNLQEFMLKMESVDDATDLLDADDGKNTFLQYACENGLYDIVYYLLSKGANPNAVIPTNRKPPIFQACSGGYYDILLLLLQYNANVAPLDGRTLLHYVVMGKQTKTDNTVRQYKRCFELLLQRKLELNLEINATDENGNSALHYAVKEKDQNYVKALLKHGAYIGLPNHFGFSPLADIDPVTFGDFLDDCITSNGKYKRDDKYELNFQFNFLKPPSCSMPMHSPQDDSDKDEENGIDDNYGHPLLPEMYALHYISKSQDLRPLLKHPVLRSFLYLKWLHVRWYFFTNLLLYAQFVVLLTLYVLCDCTREVETYKNCTSYPSFIIGHTALQEKSFLWTVLLCVLLLLVCREAFQIVMNPKRYFCSLENYMEMILIGVTFIIVSQKWEFCCFRSIYSIAILLSWAELFMQVGRLQSLSTYNEMMKRVLWNYTKFLIWDSLLIIAFALGFYTLFHEVVHKENDEINFFQNPAISLFKTVIMLTGEFDSASLPFGIVPSISYAMFILFIFLIPLVMVNLLHGLAVSDTQAIKEDAELVSIESLVELIFYFENMLLGHTVTNCLKKQCCWSQSYAHKFLTIHRGIIKFFLYPDTLGNKFLRIKPNYGRKFVVCSNSVHPRQAQETEEQIKSWCCMRIFVAKCCTIDRSLLKAAMDIIDKKSDLSQRDVVGRLESIETTVSKIQEDLEKIVQLYCRCPPKVY